MTAASSIDVLALVRDGLVTDAVWRDEVGSTNTVLLTEPPFGDRDGLFLFGADCQTAGRGRGRHRWQAPTGALTFSLLLRGQVVDDLLPLRVALAVCAAAESTAWCETMVKWPNDVYMGGRKLAGILIEANPKVGTVVGVGLNVNNRRDDAPADLREEITSLADERGHAVDRQAVLRALLTAWPAMMQRSRGETIAATRERDFLLGREVAVVDGPEKSERVRGRAAGWATNGGLQIKTEEQVVTMIAGSVQILSAIISDTKS